MYDGVIEKPKLNDVYLEHHGIKGQSWGVRNGPPYPLDSSKSTGSRLKMSGSATKKKDKKSSVKTATSKQSIKDRYDNLSDAQKKTIKVAGIATAAIAAGTLATVGGVKLKVLSDATKYGNEVSRAVSSVLKDSACMSAPFSEIAKLYPVSTDKAIDKAASKFGDHYKQVYKWETERAIRDGLRKGNNLKSALKSRNYNTSTFQAEYLADLYTKYDKLTSADISANPEKVFPAELMEYFKKQGVKITKQEQAL